MWTINETTANDTNFLEKFPDPLFEVETGLNFILQNVTVADAGIYSYKNFTHSRLIVRSEFH